MIYRLEIENFYSVRDRQVLDLTVPRTTPENSERFAPIFGGSELRAPKVVAVFGANGSGKSNLLRALAFIMWFVRDSFSQNPALLPCERFNDEECAEQPVRLAIEFGGPMVLSQEALKAEAEGATLPQGVYRYELELLTSKGIVTSVGKEALRQRKEGRGRWQRVFERVAGEKLSGSKVFPLTGYSQVIDKIPGNASAIGTLARFEHDQAQVLVAAARRVLSNILGQRTDLTDRETERLLADRPDIVEQLNKELRRIDVGIREMTVVTTDDGPSAMFKHEGLFHSMPWVLESHGTQSFIRMFPVLFVPLANGGLAILDEMDLSIHPLVLPEIVSWYYDPARNPRNAQLWISCQSASLLEDLTKEEVVLCEKDRRGRTQIYSLMDVKEVLRRDNLYKKYLSGVFGAVPNIG